MSNTDKYGPHDLQLMSRVYDFYYDHLQFCGCGAAGETLLFIRDVLWWYYRIAWAARDHNPLHLDPRHKPAVPFMEVHREMWTFLHPNGEQDDRLAYMTLYTLDAAGLMEHGGNVSGGWLSPAGETFLGALLQLTDEQIDDAIGNEGYFSDEGTGKRQRRCHAAVLREALRKYIAQAPEIADTLPEAFTKEEWAILQQLRK